MFTYKKLLNSDFIKRVEDDAVIPRDIMNSDYQLYLDFIASGGVTLPADPPELTKDQIDAESARMYQKLKMLKSMTPSEIQTWVSNNVNNLSDVRDAITTLAIAVSILARRI